jgi:flagellar protein FlbD
MIHLTRLNHRPLVLNADLIESIEVIPDTVIALTTGQKLVVLESVDEVVRLVVEFRRAIHRGDQLGTQMAGAQNSCSSGPGDEGRNRTGHGGNKPEDA